VEDWASGVVYAPAAQLDRGGCVGGIADGPVRAAV